MKTRVALLFTAALLLCAECILSADRCPHCGTTAVPYPLSTEPTCGDQSYKIRCLEGKLMFDTLNNSYPVISIDPSTQRLVIRPASLLPNTCVTSDMVHQGIHLNDSLPFSITNRNYIMYLNCTESVLRSPMNCSSNSLCHSYIDGTSGAAPCVQTPICCSFRTGGSSSEYMIRVRERGCSAYASFVDLDRSLPGNQWPEPGMEIQWA